MRINTKKSAYNFGELSGRNTDMKCIYTSSLTKFGGYGNGKANFY